MTLRRSAGSGGFLDGKTAGHRDEKRVRGWIKELTALLLVFEEKTDGMCDFCH